jgi:hypothetical protein
MAFQKATCVPSCGVSKTGLPAWGFRDHREIVAVAALPDSGAFRSPAANSQRPSPDDDKSSLILHAAKRRVVMEVSSVLGSNHTDDRSRQEEAALDGIPSGSHRGATHWWHDIRIRAV